MLMMYRKDCKDKLMLPIGAQICSDALLHPAAFKLCCRPGADRDASKPLDAAAVHLR